MLAVIGHGRPSLVVLAWAASLICSVATNSWPAVPSVLHPNSSIGRPVGDTCFHKGQKGIRVVDLTSHQTVLDINDETPPIPASTTKLITSAVAPLRLPPRDCFRTAFLSTGPVRDGVLHGDLYLKGYGDPALVLGEAWLLARGLRKQGVHSIRGDLVGDDSLFGGEARGSDRLMDHRARWNELGRCRIPYRST